MACIRLLSSYNVPGWIMTWIMGAGGLQWWDILCFEGNTDKMARSDSNTVTSITAKELCEGLPLQLINSFQPSVP